MRNIYIFFVIVIFTISCNNREKQINNRWKYYRETSILKEEISNEIYLRSKDTVTKWIDSNLRYWAFNVFEHKKDWKLFNIVLLNSERNKVVLYGAARNLNSDTES